MKIYWMQPGKIDSVSGGYIYNKNIIEGIRARTVDVELLIPGTDFPFPSQKSIETCRKFFRNMERSSVVVVDSLILGTIPELIEECEDSLVIAGMIHLPLSLSPDFTQKQKENFRTTEMRSFRHSKLLIVNSVYLKSELIKMGVEEDKIHVVSPGINTTIQNRNYPEKPTNLLCVSRISGSKGQLDLVKALQNLQHLNWKLTFCGGFDTHDEYFKAISSGISNAGMEDRITFTGEISSNDLENYYRQADLLALTSYYETYSMVLQEAMAFKIPIISTNAGAAIKTADSHVTKFYSPGDVHQLEKHLISVLNDSNEYKKLANGYSDLNLNLATWRQQADQFLQIIDNR